MVLFMLSPAIVVGVVGLMIVISPRMGIKKGQEITEEGLKKSRNTGWAMLCVGAVLCIGGLVKFYLL